MQQEQICRITPLQTKKFVKSSGIFYRLFVKKNFCKCRRDLDTAIRRNIYSTKEYSKIEDKKTKKELDTQVRKIARIYLLVFRFARIFPIEDFYARAADSLNTLIENRVKTYANPKEAKSAPNTDLIPNR